TNATTTALAITGISSSLLKTLSNGAVVAAVAGTDYQTFAYLFPGNATSTQLAFSGGLTAVGATTTALAVTSSTTVAGALNATGAVLAGTFSGAGLATCQTENVLTWSAGVFGCEADTAGGGGADFTYNQTNYGLTVSATSTPVWFRSGFMASSTSYIHALQVGSSTVNTFANAPLLITGNVNSYVQTVLQNTNSGTLASADFIVGADLMTDSKYYGDLGYNSSGNADPTYAGFGRNSFYLYNSDGEVALATASSTNTSAVIKFLTGGTLAANERARISQTGLFGIGTTSPFGLLALHALNGATNNTLFAIGSSTSNSTTTLFSVSNAGVTTIGDSSSSGDAVIQLANDTNAWSFGYRSTDKTFRVASSTNLTANVLFQIGKSGTTSLNSAITSSNVGQYLCIDTATFEIIRNNTACSASSARYKENIVDSVYGLDAIMQLRSVMFTFKEEMNFGTSTQIGFIAEEVEGVLPELVAYDKSGLPSGVNYPLFTSVLAKAIQELNLNLSDLASTTASSTPQSQNFAESFFNNIFSRITTWLANAANGITKLFAKEVHTEQLCVRQSNGTEICMTGDQLANLLAGAGLPNSGGGGETAPTPEPTPAP
ncbi:MAG: tail fiber domain-containing protein, partial [Patescibacteria group bacterium]